MKSLAEQGFLSEERFSSSLHSFSHGHPVNIDWVSLYLLTISEYLIATTFREQKGISLYRGSSRGSFVGGDADIS